MKKFLEWMEDKYRYSFKSTMDFTEKSFLRYYHKQMLIGYMIEYLMSKGLFRIGPEGEKTINQYYQYLKQEMKEVERKENAEKSKIQLSN